MPECANAATKDRVADIVCKLLEKQGLARSIDQDDDLAHLGLASADMINLMLTIEAEFNISIPDREMRPANFRSISSIDALVRALRPDR